MHRISGKPSIVASSIHRIALLCALSASLACDDEGKGAPVANRRPPDGKDDGGASSEAGVTNPMDGSTTPTEDGSIPPVGDASVPDGFGCSFAESDHFSDDAHLPGGMSFALDVVGNRLHLTYLVPSCTRTTTDGGVDVYGTGLKYVTFDTSEALPQARVLVDTAVSCNQPQYPALTAKGDDVRVYYVDRSGRRPELFETSLAEGAVPTVLSYAEERESHVAAMWVGAVPIVSWALGAGVTPQSIWTVRHDTSPTPQEIVAVSKAYEPTYLVAAALNSRRGLLAWVSLVGTPGIFAQVLSEQGAVSGSVQVVTRDLGGASSVDLVVRGDDQGIGALAYAAGSEQRYNIKFREMDAQGALIGKEQSIASGDLRDPGITAFSTGYAIAYRVASSSGHDTPIIRVAFTDAQGNLAGTRDVSAAASAGGPVRIRQALDGRLFVTWVDAGPEGTKIHAVRMICQ